MSRKDTIKSLTRRHRPPIVHAESSKWVDSGPNEVGRFATAAPDAPARYALDSGARSATRGPPPLMTCKRSQLNFGWHHGSTMGSEANSGMINIFLGRGQCPRPRNSFIMPLFKSEPRFIAPPKIRKSWILTESAAVIRRVLHVMSSSTFPHKKQHSTMASTMTRT